MGRVLVWNDWNEAHIAKHGVDRHEVRDVMAGPGGRVPRGRGDGKFLVAGVTRAGRHLQVIFVSLADEQVDVNLLEYEERVRFEQGDEAVYVIHARELKPRERTRGRR